MTETLKNYLRMCKGIVTIARDPGQTNAVFEIGKGVEQSGILNRVAGRLRASTREVDQLFQDRYNPPLADLAVLRKLPEGTLGRTFADYMVSMGFEVQFFPEVEVENDGSYLLQRLRHTHDIWHTITGFSTDPKGELGLQAFYLAQVGGLLPPVLLATGFVRTLFHPRELGPLWHEVRRGWQMGKRCKPLLGQRFEDGWDKPLATWRAQVGLN